MAQRWPVFPECFNQLVNALMLHRANVCIRVHISYSARCVSNDCKLNLAKIRGDVYDQWYVDEMSSCIRITTTASCTDPYIYTYIHIYIYIYIYTPHKMYLLQDYFHQIAIGVMLWPGMSPDLNITENICCDMSCQFNAATVLPGNAEQLGWLCTTLCRCSSDACSSSCGEPWTVNCRCHQCTRRAHSLLKDKMRTLALLFHKSYHV